MAEMGRYCKAYPIQRFREFPDWSESAEHVRSETQDAAGRELEEPQPLTDDSFLYLQENFVVTAGIAKDESVIFDNVTPEWKEFCTRDLQFTVPNYEFADDDG